MIYFQHYRQTRLDEEAGARHTNDISIEWKIRPKFAVLCLKMYFEDHNDILQTPRQCNRARFRCGRLSTF